MELMARYPDKHFDLAIVDPPYGIGMDGGKIGADNLGQATPYVKKNWDNSPPHRDYFIELFRVSQEQIIWGANNMMNTINKSSSCWIVWDKDNSGNFADCELAFTSFKSAVRKFIFRWNGMLQGDMKNKEQRIHPTQKPVALYKWLLSKYAKPGQKILDTHLGSGSSAIACYDMSFPLTACEIDEDYFTAAVARLRLFAAQGTLDFGGLHENS
jgi:site-specific DNA-methyltransferase (adenine-specific)